ncbi:MAG: hypothetical protein GX214_02360 [Clostridiales bacterium]|nr:hypothetical protein [Clostridiales bacterium]
MTTISSLQKPGSIREKEDFEALVEELTDEELAEIDKIVGKTNPDVQIYTNRIEYLKSKNTNLINRLSYDLYLSIDSEAQPIHTFDLNINMTNDTNEIDEVMDSRKILLLMDYRDAIESNNFLNYISEYTNGIVSADQVTNLINVKINSDKNINVFLTAPTKPMLDDLVSATKIYIEKHKGDQTLFSYEHSLEIINEKSEIINNQSIDEKKTMIREDIDNNLIEIEQEEKDLEILYTAAMDEQSIKYLESKAKTMKDEVSIEKSVAGFSIKKIILNLIIGGILGLILATGWSVNKMFSDRRLYNVDILSNEVGLFRINNILLSSEQESNEPKKLGKRIDKLIEKKYLAEKDNLSDDPDKQIKFAAAFADRMINNVTNIAADQEKLVLLGDITTDSIQSYCKKFKNYFAQFMSDNKANLQCVDLNLDGSSAIADLSNADYVILLVRPRKSLTEKILRSLEMLSMLDIRVIGYVSVEEINTR